MQIISHRGYWKTVTEKNTEAAFIRSFSLGFGTETDIRDFNGDLVIAHDIASAQAMPLAQFFQIYTEHGYGLPLALNIKSDGLQDKLREYLTKFDVNNYFVFDMSIPDTIGFLKQGFNVYTRHSDIEPTPALYDEAQGVWLDTMRDDWVSAATLQAHAKQQKPVCIVSPELHRRPYLKTWQYYREISLTLDQDLLMLCSDKPEEAKEFFND